MKTPIVCPPKNNSAWKTLVQAIGEAPAYLAFFRNGDVIPDPVTARALLGMKDAKPLAPKRTLSKSKKSKAPVLKTTIELRPVVALKIKTGKFAKPCRQVNLNDGRHVSHPRRQPQMRQTFRASAKLSI